MKRQILHFAVAAALLCLSQHTLNAQVGVGTTTPDNSARLEVTSTTSGFLTPRMTAAQRADINSPATGLIVYQTDGVTGFYYNVGTPASPNWVILLNGGADGKIGVDKINASGIAATKYLKGDGTWGIPAAGVVSVRHAIGQQVIIQSTDVFVFTTATNTEFTLPDPAANTGRVIWLSTKGTDQDVFTVIVSGNGIIYFPDGTSSQTASNRKRSVLISDGDNWIEVSATTPSTIL